MDPSVSSSPQIFYKFIGETKKQNYINLNLPIYKDLITIHNSPFALQADLDYIYNLSMCIPGIENYVERTMVDFTGPELYMFLRTRAFNLRLISESHENKLPKTSKTNQILEIGTPYLFVCESQQVPLALDTLSEGGILCVRFELVGDSTSIDPRLGYHLSFCFNVVSIVKPIADQRFVYIVGQGYSSENKKYTLEHIKKSPLRVSVDYNEFIEKLNEQTNQINQLRLTDKCRILTDWDVENSVFSDVQKSESSPIDQLISVMTDIPYSAREDVIWSLKNWSWTQDEKYLSKVGFYSENKKYADKIYPYVENVYSEIKSAKWAWMVVGLKFNIDTKESYFDEISDSLPGYQKIEDFIQKLRERNVL